MEKGTMIKFINSINFPKNIFMGEIVSIFHKFNKEEKKKETLIRVMPERLNGKFLASEQRNLITIKDYLIKEVL